MLNVGVYVKNKRLMNYQDLELWILVLLNGIKIYINNNYKLKTYKTLLLDKLIQNLKFINLNYNLIIIQIICILYLYSSNE